MRPVAPAVRHQRPSRGRPPTPGLREAILAAAQGVFTRRDYHEVQMDGVARACGVGKGTIYRYFRTKRELYLAVMFGGIERLRAELEAAVRTRESPVAKIEHVVRRTLGYFWDQRHFFALIHRNEHRPDDDARDWVLQRARLVRPVQSAIDQAIAGGHVRRMDSRLATEMLFGMMRAASRYRGRDDDLETLVATVVDVFLHGTGKRGAARPSARVA
ncbi:MAG TPA: TetR/AcrR family transcriptional regulator [Candidatus Eisenbacteria bacterium]|nr:TetR/AcrR family transcriptional regulator [Candidatus Eisenbacteria bacterium]